MWVDRIAFLLLSHPIRYKRIGDYAREKRLAIFPEVIPDKSVIDYLLI